MADNTSEFIKSIDLFEGLSNRDLSAIAATLKRRDFPAGKPVVNEGEGGVGFFIIETGTATVRQGDREVAKIGPGSYFGEIALLAGSNRSASIVADGELSCLGMTAWDFKPMVRSHPSVALKLLEKMAHQLAG